jgi:hypothetical protein
MNSQPWVSGGDDDISMGAPGEKLKEIDIWIICIVK